MKDIIFFSFILCGIIYSTFIERKLLISKKFNIKKENIQNIDTKIKVIQFTDVHLGRYFSLKDLEKVVDKINSLNPDIVVLTGDLVDKMRFYQHKEEIPKVLSKINSKLGNFAIYGNHDAYPGNRHSYAEIIKNSNFTLLINENRKIKIGSKTLNLMGLDDIFQGKINIDSTIKNINKNDFNLLMLHEPDLIDKFKGQPIDLAVAGHSHGGQIYVPLYGTILNTECAVKYDRGFHLIGDNNQDKIKLYVNTGIGSTGLPIRFWNIPNVVEFNIEF